MPLRTSRASSSLDTAARPKSMMRTSPPASIMMLAGLKSRCSTPFACAAASPAHSFRAISIPLSTGSRPMRFSSAARSSPSTYSIDRRARRAPRRCRRRGTRWDARAAAPAALRCAAADARARPTAAPEEFERHRLAELEVVRAVDLAHAAAAERRDDPEAVGEHRTRPKAALDAVGGQRAAAFRTELGGRAERCATGWAHRGGLLRPSGARPAIRHR